MKMRKMIFIIILIMKRTIKYPARDKKALSNLTETLQDLFWETKTVYPKPVGVTAICIHY